MCNFAMTDHSHRLCHRRAHTGTVTQTQIRLQNVEIKQMKMTKKMANRPQSYAQ